METNCCSYTPAGEVDGFEVDDTYMVGGFEVDKATFLEHQGEAHAFETLFDEADVAALKALGNEITAEAATKKPAKKDGIWYLTDSQDGGSSTYVVNAGGKTMLHVVVDNANEMHVDGLPEGVTAHSITVYNAKKDSFLTTKGWAIRGLHADGSGVHVDGNTVRSYVGPRVWKWLAHFYGV